MDAQFSGTDTRLTSTKVARSNPAPADFLIDFLFDNSITNSSYASFPGTNGCPADSPPHTAIACPFT
jgi:hypothetical protein